MPDNFVGSFLINVQGATNPTLGQNGQGVCGVILHFDHEYLGDLQITLTSPGGQTVTLVGPIGLFGPTDFTNWDVTFLPCADPVSPDPGFSATWNNNQPWGLFGNYTGSYHPYNGCLENFNGGPVNGTWTLTVVDGQAVDVGNFTDYEIIFCDDSGIECFTCAANAGNLLQADVSGCEGSAVLNMNLPPSFPPSPPNPPQAPAPEYSYTYVIAGPGGVIQEYNPSPDLTAYPPGGYTVCGMSYYATDEPDIPAPNGTLTINQLSTQLTSSTPPFCGKITVNCVNVNVLPAPPDEEEFQTICGPGCYTFHGSNYCQTGDYTVPLSQNGCPYTGVLHLTVVPPVNQTMNETICAGGCSTIPGFETACAQGQFVGHFETAAGCDSVVTLNLNVITAQANIVQPGPLPCSGGTLQLQGTGSTTGPGVTYHWTASNGGSIVGNPNTINANINAAGDYCLRVCRSSAGTSCCDSTCVTVMSDQTPPAPPLQVNGTNPICSGATLNYSIQPVFGATSYTWTVPAGVVINSGQGTTNINVTWNSLNGGPICVTADNACASSTPTCLDINIQLAPVATAPQGPGSICAGSTATYSIPPINGATSYAWQVPAGGIIVSGQNTASISVLWNNTPGGNVCVSAQGACGTGPQSCTPVAVVAQPVANAGPDGSVCGLSIALQAVNSVAGSTGAWTQVSGPGTSTFTNAGSPVSFVDVTQNGTYTFRWTETNGACVDSDTVSVNFNASPVAGSPTIVCDGTGSTFTVGFTISGGTPPYSVPGGTVTGSNFVSLPLANGSSYSFTVTDANGCTSTALTGTYNCACTTNAGSMSAILLEACEGQTVTAGAPGSPVLDGNDTGSFALHTLSGNMLGTVFAQNTTGTFGLQAGMAFETTYYISYIVGNNLNGAPDPADPCFSVAPGQPVVFHQNPVANAGLDSDTCGLSLPLSGSGAGTGSWTTGNLPAGGSLTFGNAQSAATTATGDIFGTYTAIWTLTSNGCTDADTVALTFHGPPSASPETTSCDAANENFTVTFTISGGTAPYSVDGVAIAGTTFTSAALPNGSTYTFLVTDANGCAAPAVTGAFSCNCATGAGQMSPQQLSACEGASVTAQHTGGENLDGNDVTAYVLHDGSGPSLGQVFDENTTGVFSFQNGMAYGTTYYISFVVGNNLNGLPDPADPCFAVAPGQPVIFYQNPAANAGVDTAICGLSISLNATPTSGSGQWSVSGQPNGATATFADPQEPASGVTASTPGTYTFDWTVTENGCIGNDQVQVQFNESPALVDLVRDCDAANENFVVTMTLTGGAPPYVVNGTQIAGNVFVSNSLPNNQAYNFAVTDANGCTMSAVIGSYNCNCTTNAGTMDLNTLTACEGQTVTAQSNGDQNLDANDMIGYVLHGNSGASLGQVFAQNTTGVFGFLPGMTYGTTYYISQVAGNSANGFPDTNDPCFSVAPGQPVVFLQNPAPDAGVDGSTCGNTVALSASTGNFSGSWVQAGGPGTASFADASASATDVTVDSFGTYLLLRTETNGICVISDTVQVTFNPVPSVINLDETCDGTNTQYTLTFDVSGGTPPFTVSGVAGTFGGNTFTANALNNGATYTFQVTDANGCTSPSLSGSHNCNCGTDAGAMQNAPAVFCAADPATAVWDNTNASTDANDIIQFILHDQAGGTVGTIFATAAQPSFSFGGSLQTGVTYYISAIAGNDAGGQVDLNDPCLSVTPGAPVQWKPMPTASLTGDATLCKGQSAALSFSGTGTYPLTATYSNGIAQNTLLLTGGQVVGLNVQPAATTTYTLLSVADGTSPTCSTALNQPVTITVNTPVEAGQAGQPIALCAGTDSLINLPTQLSGADSNGQWKESSVSPSAPGAFNAANASLKTAGLAPGTYKFTYLLTALAPCPSDSATVSVVISPKPVADAGNDVLLDCAQPSATLGGPGTSLGSGIVYSWTKDGAPAGNTKQLDVSAPGVYRLGLVTAAGCTDEDEATVTLDAELPFANFLVKPVRCYHDKNGSIAVDSVSSAHPPVLFSFNGGPFSTQTNYGPLQPGPYTMTLQDAAGCEWTSDTLWVLEPPLIVAELGPNLELMLGDSAHATLQLSVPLSSLDTIFWFPLLDTLDAGQPRQDFLPLQSLLLGVRVIDTSGCVVNDKVVVEVSTQRHVYFPSGVFPGSENENEGFLVAGGQDVAEIESLKIYDRWGELMYQAQHFQPDDPAYAWTGTFKGSDVSPGVYTFLAVVRFIDGKSEIFTGDFTIVR